MSNKIISLLALSVLLASCGNANGCKAPIHIKWTGGECDGEYFYNSYGKSVVQCTNGITVYNASNVTLGR